MATDAIRTTHLRPRDKGAKDLKLRQGESALVIRAEEGVISALEELLEQLSRQDADSDRLLQHLTEAATRDILDEPRMLQLTRQAEIRRNFLSEFATLTSGEIGEMSGSTARNKSALASRWKSEGKVFAVTLRGVDQYPAFQFGDEGRPLPVMAALIRLFGEQGEWALALWLRSPSGWLRGRRPVDLLREDPEAVVEAARRAVAPSPV